jgi:Flp pilus assembly protein protease CpaA
LAVIGFTFPLLLWGIGKLWYGIPLQNSMSAYYFAQSPHPEGGIIRTWLRSIDFSPISTLLGFLDQLDSNAPMRSWFVGLLFVFGVLLYLYKGFTIGENWWLNAAGIFAIGVALFPMCWEGGANCPSFSVHGTVAMLAFLCIAVVAVWSAQNTLYELLKNGSTIRQGSRPNYRLTNWFYMLILWIIDLLVPLARIVRGWLRREDQFEGHEKLQRYRNRYDVTGTLMIIFPLIAVAITTIIDRHNLLTFILEWLGIWFFGAFWVIKTVELEESQAEIHAIAKQSVIPRALAKQAVDSPVQNPLETPESAASTMKNG